MEALSGRGPAAAPSAPAPPPPAVTVLACGPHEITESPVHDRELLRGMRGRWPVLWVHVNGMEHAPTLEGLRGVLGLSSEAVERLLDPHARAGAERAGEHLLALAPFGAGAEGRDLGRAAVLAAGDHLLTLQSGPGDRFGELREALRSPYSRLRGAGSAGVALAAMEAVLGAAADAAAGYARRVAEVEAEVLASPSAAAMAHLHALRRELRVVERAVQPLPAHLLAAAADPAPLPADSAPRLRALAERSDAAHESVGAAREAAASVGEACLAGMQRRTEARVRTLTVLCATLLLAVLFGFFWIAFGG